MLGGEKAAVAFHGDHEPVSIYVDGQAINEPAESTKSGAQVEFDGTYNDAAEVSVEGKSTQDGTPTPDAPVPIESIKSVELVSRGRNLLGTSSEYVSRKYAGTIPTYGKHSVEWDTSVKWCGDNIVFSRLDVKPGEVYTVSAIATAAGYENNNNGNGFRALIDFHTENGDRISNASIVSGRNDHSWSYNNTFAAYCATPYNKHTMYNDGATPNDYTFIVPEDAAYVLVGINSWIPEKGVRFRLSDIMLVGGDQPMPYEPYKTATRTIDLQGHELRSLPDGTHDELVVHRDGTVELVQRVLVADSNSNWTAIGHVNENGIAYVAMFVNNAEWSINLADRKIISSIGVQTYLFAESKMAGFSYNGKSVFYRWPDTSASLEKAKADMLSSGAYALYPDEHPQTIQLPSIDPLPTYHPYTFVDGNGADISAHVKVIP